MEDNKLAIKNNSFFYEESAISQYQAHDTTYLYLNFSPTNYAKRQLDPKEIIYLSTVKWGRLIYIDLDGNGLGNEGAKYLSRVQMPNVKTVILSRNRMGDAGVQHISKADWSCLQSLCLIQNKFGTESAKWLIRSKWPKIKQANLALNKFTLEQLQQLLKHQFAHLHLLILLDALNEEEEKSMFVELLEQKCERTFANL